MSETARTIDELTERIASILELPESEQQAAFDELRANNPQQRGFLLRCEEAAKRIAPACDPQETLAQVLVSTAHEEAVPDRIGPYTIVEPLGEGGMGTVYLAEQEQPVRRQVALKVIKLGMDTKSVLSRFEAERRAVALMEHDNIAKVYDAGATEDGRPYFVMEYVKGVSLTRYCDQEQLGLESRLRLFQDVCAGVQHAHQKGIIHRDLKPSNIVVSIQGGKPVPKIIDFGLARATGQGLLDDTMFTEQGQVIGTPEYMSPEQAGFGDQDIDTRTDIYSLGVLLYELLVGQLPLPDLRTRSLPQMQRSIQEDDPLKPSSRVSTLNGDGVRIAEARCLDASTLARGLRDDLDWITMRALEKDRSRRYATADAFAEDIARHLAHEPVEASPPSTAYRLKKFLRKRRGPVAAASALFVMMLIGTITTLVFAFRASAFADLSSANEKRAVKVARFQGEILTSIDREEIGRSLLAGIRHMVRDELTRRGLSDRAVSRKVEQVCDVFSVHAAATLATDVIDTAVLERAESVAATKFGSEPQIQGQVLQSVADVAFELGLMPRARQAQAAVLEVSDQAFGEGSRDSLIGSTRLGRIELNSLDAQAAERCFQNALRIGKALSTEQLSGLAREHIRLATAGLGRSLINQGRFGEARPYVNAALAERRRIFGDDHSKTLSSQSDLAWLLMGEERYAEAEAMLRQIVARMRQSNEGHALASAAAHNLGALLVRNGHLTEAESLLTENLELRRISSGSRDPLTLQSLGQMAALRKAQGQLEAAEANAGEALHGVRLFFGRDHRLSIRSELEYIGILVARREFAKAVPMLRGLLDRARRVLGNTHIQTLRVMNAAGFSALETGDIPHAEELYREALDARRRTLGAQHPDTLQSLNNLGYLMGQKGQHADALSLLRGAVDGRRRRLGDDHPATLQSIDNLSRVLLKMGRHDDEALSLRRLALEISRRISGEQSLSAASALAWLGAVLNEQGRWRAAEDPLNEALAIRTGVLPKGDWRVVSTMNLLGKSLIGQKRYASAQDVLQRCLDIQGQGDSKAGKGHIRTTIRSLVELCEKWSKPEKAQEWRTQLGRLADGGWRKR